MIVLVISDVHDRRGMLTTALAQGREKGCEAVIFCGDTSSPKTFSLLIDDKRPLYAVLGNIEHDIEETKRIAKESDHCLLDPNVLTLTLDNRHIAITHYPGAAQTLAKEKKYDAVFHGHTHRPRIEYQGRVLLGNPGEISGHITGKRSFGVYDTRTNGFEIVPLL